MVFSGRSQKTIRSFSSLDMAGKKFKLFVYVSNDDGAKIILHLTVAYHQVLKFLIKVGFRI